MIKTQAIRLAASALGLAVLMACAAPSAHGGYIDYVVTPSVTGVTTPGSGTTITGGTESVVQGAFAQPTAPFSGVLISNGAGPFDDNEVRIIGLRSNPGTPAVNANNLGTNIVIAQIDALESINSPNQMIDFNFKLSLAITDYTDRNRTTIIGTGTLVLNGRISGTLGDGQITIDTLVFAPTSASTTIGTDTVTVSYNGSFTFPGEGNNGALGVRIRASSVPEPASVAMLGLGGIGAMGLFRRSRKAKASA